MDQPALALSNASPEAPQAASQTGAPTPVAEALGPRPALVKVFARDIREPGPVDTVFAVRERSIREKRSGGSFLKLQLADVTGAIEAVAWDDVETLAGVAAPGAVVRVRGSYETSERYGGSLKIAQMRLARREEFDPVDLLDGPPLGVGEMTADLRALIGTVENQHLHALLEGIFGEDTPTWANFREAPAAKHYHQAYRHGLLEHTLSVAQGVSAMAATFPGLDRDVAVAGALLHDIGKLETYQFEQSTISMTDAGRLLGEIPLGYYFVRRTIEEIAGFPAETAQAVLHIVLSHHGRLEHGSPVVPATREATLVHMIDNLGGTLGTFDRIEKSLAAGERWSGFDRALSSSAFFPGAL